MYSIFIFIFFSIFFFLVILYNIIFISKSCKYYYVIVYIIIMYNLNCTYNEISINSNLVANIIKLFKCYYIFKVHIYIFFLIINHISFEKINNDWSRLGWIRTVKLQFHSSYRSLNLVRFS